MRINVNLRHLEKHGLILSDSLPAESIELVSQDELIRFKGDVRYDLEVQKLEQSVLAQGCVSVALECDCARCLKTFSVLIELPGWTALMPLSGEEAVAVVNDCVDLTPFIREDIFLALPQHPLCSKECQGLLREQGGGAESPSDSSSGPSGNPIWAGLDELKL